MKSYLPAMLLLSAFSLTAFVINTEPIPIGSAIPKPDHPLKDISGKTVTLKQAMQTKGILVMFSCNTCPVVHSNQQRTREICAYAASKKIGVVLLNSNEAARDGQESLKAMQQYAGEQHYNWYYAVDHNNILADAFGATRTPECYLFDASAKLVYHGAIDDSPQDASGVSREHLKIAMDEMTGGREVSIKTTRSIGCGIKRI